MTSTSTQPATSPKGFNIALWSVQGLLALTFVGTGLWKLATPIPELASRMPWMGQVSPAFLQAAPRRVASAPRSVRMWAAAAGRHTLRS